MIQGAQGPLEKDQEPALSLAVPPATPGPDSCSSQQCHGVQGRAVPGSRQRVYLQLERALMGPQQSTAGFYVRRCCLPLSGPWPPSWRERQQEMETEGSHQPPPWSGVLTTRRSKSVEVMTVRTSLHCQAIIFSRKSLWLLSFIA